ncbi:MAG: alpha/beta hydrolase fold protein [Conexibacter sp.]|nr:alpha/beta hydrolase fold protein [Conexibacter sp.]
MSGASPVVDATAPDDYGPGGRSAWMDIDWRVHQRWVEVAGRPVNVVELGEGPPMVFIHGLSGSWQNWLETLPHFARSHRVVAFDLPGFGASGMPAELPISISGYARIVDELCDALAIDAAAVVGNSMGGFIAAELAISFPQRVERLVLVSAAGLSSDSMRREPLLTSARVLAATSSWTASKLESFARRPGLRRLALRYVFHRPDRLPAALAFEQMKGSGKPGFVPALDALLSYPIRNRIPQIACPTLIVWGTHDRLVPVRDASEFERLIPDARKVVFPETGHASMLERPARFNALLDSFVAA